MSYKDEDKKNNPVDLTNSRNRSNTDSSNSGGSNIKS